MSHVFETKTDSFSAELGLGYSGSQVTEAEKEERESEA
jgi:hypothetical protein